MRDSAQKTPQVSILMVEFRPSRLNPLLTPLKLRLGWVFGHSLRRPRAAAALGGRVLDRSAAGHEIDDEHNQRDHEQQVN